MLEKAETNGIRVEVESSFVPEQSDRDASHFFFSYRIRIHNKSALPVQLISRHWIITDGVGRTEEVKGAGVIGQQPSLEPGETFEYESFCPLPTPTGSMRGTYMMVDLKTGKEFAAEIPQFFLIEPNSYH